MAYLSPNRVKKGVSYIAVVGAIGLAFGLGVGFAKNYTVQAYKLGYEKAQADLAKGAFLDNDKLAKSACTDWWFGAKYRLKKEK